MRTISKILMGLFIGTMMSLVFSSCTKTEGSVDSKKIVGDWKLVNVIYKTYLNGEEKDGYEDNCSTWHFIFNFKADGTGMRTSINKNSGENTEYPITSWKIVGSKIEMWEVEDGVKRFVQMDIEELSDDTLIFSGAPEQKTENGILKHYVKYTYKRI